MSELYTASLSPRFQELTDESALSTETEYHQRRGELLRLFRQFLEEKILANAMTIAELNTVIEEWSEFLSKNTADVDFHDMDDDPVVVELSTGEKAIGLSSNSPGGVFSVAILSAVGGEAESLDRTS